MQIAGEEGIVHDGNQAEKRESMWGGGIACLISWKVIYTLKFNWLVV